MLSSNTPYSGRKSMPSWDWLGLDGPVVGIADHRNGFRLGDNVAAQRRADRAAARARGTHAVASVARQQALQYANLHAAHLAAQAGKRKRK